VDIWGIMVDIWEVTVDIWGIMVDIWGIMVDIWEVIVDIWAVMVDIWEAMVDSPLITLHISRGGTKMTLGLTRTDFSQTCRLFWETVLPCKPIVRLNLLFHRILLIWNLVHPMLHKDPEAPEGHTQYVTFVALLMLANRCNVVVLDNCSLNTMNNNSWFISLGFVDSSHSLQRFI